MIDYSFQPKKISLTKISIFRMTKAKIVILIFFIILITIGIFKINKSHSSTNNNLPTGRQTTPKIEEKTISTQSFPSPQLVESLVKEINTHQGTYSIYIYDLKTKKEFAINEKTIYDAASVNKIPILASLYYYADTENLDLGKTVTLQEKDRQDYGTGSIRYDPAGTVYSIKTLARLMMEKSDNTAAYILANHVIGLSKMQTLVDNWGLIQTDMYKNDTSLKDIALLLEKIYQGEITSAALTSEMLDFMDKSDFDDRIPKYLPSDIKIYHKTGDNVAIVHDIGLIDLPNRPYIIGVFTMDVTSDVETKEAIARLSELVFNEMKKL